MLQVPLLLHEEHDVTQVDALGARAGRYAGRPAAPAAASFAALVKLELFALGPDGGQSGGVRLRMSEILEGRKSGKELVISVGDP